MAGIGVQCRGIVSAVGDQAADRAGGSDQLIGSLMSLTLPANQPDDGWAAKDVCEDVDLGRTPTARETPMACAFGPIGASAEEALRFHLAMVSG